MSWEKNDEDILDGTQSDSERIRIVNEQKLWRKHITAKTTKMVVLRYD